MCIHSSIKSKQKLIIYANLSGEIERDFSILSWSLVSKETFIFKKHSSAERMYQIATVAAQSIS